MSSQDSKKARQLGRVMGVGLLLFGLAELANAAPAVKDGPFGIYMGEPLSALRPVAQDDPSSPRSSRANRRLQDRGRRKQDQR